MKRYITYSLLLVASILALVSCNSFLEDNPTDRLSEDDAYNTISDLRNNALGSIYLNIGGSSPSQGLQGTARGVWDLNTFTTDEAIIPTRGADWYDGGIWQNLFLHRFGNVDFTGDTWNYLFKEVLACNRALERIDAYSALHPGDDVTEMRARLACDVPVLCNGSLWQGAAVHEFESHGAGDEVAGTFCGLQAHR